MSRLLAPMEQTPLLDHLGLPVRLVTTTQRTQTTDIHKKGTRLVH